MATGPEHYREAERLATAARATNQGETLDYPNGEPILEADAAGYAALAQVHATLALAAATALNFADPGSLNDPDCLAWREVVCGPVSASAS